MGTRGLLGIRNNKKLLIGNYNHYDSYYSSIGGEVINLYFDKKGRDILKLTKYNEDERDFLQNGLFCEYAYIYNQDNDTLEIYRGFFETKQGFNTKEKIINVLEQKKDKHFCHLIMIIDRKKHKKEQVIKAFNNYDDGEEDKKDYPEREIIHLELPENYIGLV